VAPIAATAPENFSYSFCLVPFALEPYLASRWGFSWIETKNWRFWQFSEQLGQEYNDLSAMTQDKESV
jgi:hypothetical protein